MSTDLPAHLAAESVNRNHFKMGFYLIVSLSLSILIAGIISVIRFKKIDKRYYPFIFLIWAACINEVLNITLVLKGHQTHVNSNIFVLVEVFLITWFFKEEGLFKSKRMFSSWLLVFSLVWITDTLVTGSITQTSVYFRIFYSFIIVFFSINMINEKIFSNRQILFKDPSFLIYISFCIYFTYKALIEAFILYGIDSTGDFFLNIYIIMIYVNFGVNLLYALAVLWIPAKYKFTRPSLSP